jgi:hypothetical protein
MAESDFLVTLPSNSNMATNPSNEQANYTVKLSEPLNLEGDWEAALVSVQYTPSWLTFPNPLTILVAYIKDVSYEDRPDTRPNPITVSNYIVSAFVRFEELLGKHGLTQNQIVRQAPKDMKVVFAKLYPKYYDTADSLGLDVCKAINDVTARDGVSVRYEYDYANKRGYFIASGGRMRIILENYIMLGELLGHNTDWLRCDKCSGWTSRDQRMDSTPHYFSMATDASKTPNLLRVSSMWIYSNITKNQQVGDAKAPLLGIVPVNGSHSQRIHYTVNPVHFLGVNRGFIPEISIQITDDKGKRIPFTTGSREDNLVCCIRFRKRKARMPI